MGMCERARVCCVLVCVCVYVCMFTYYVWARICTHNVYIIHTCACIHYNALFVYLNEY